MNPLRNYTRHRAGWIVGALLAFIAISAGFTSLRSGFHWPLRAIWLASALLIFFETARFLATWRPDRKTFAFTCVLVLFLVLMLEGICWLFLGIMAQRDDRSSRRGTFTMTNDVRERIKFLMDGRGETMFSPTLGWLPKPGARNREYVISDQGLRGERHYDPIPPDRSRRVLCMGDSFTFGIAVLDDETYPAYAESSLPDTEWLNFGNPGCCLTQVYLRYHEQAKAFDGKYVVIGFMTNDAQRTVNCFRPFLNASSGVTMTKPFAKFGENGLTIEPNPYLDATDYQALLDNPKAEMAKLRELDYLTWSGQRLAKDPIARTFAYVMGSPRLGRNLEAITRGHLPFRSLRDRLADGDCYGDSIWRTESLGFQAITALFDRFYAEVEQNGSIPLIVIIPGPLDVRNHEKGLPRQYDRLLAHLEERRYRHLDFLDPLLKRNRDDLSPEALFVRAHYQPHVNRLLADEIIKALGLR